ncbi:MAG: VOC family protein [Myxococcales bacterium]|nr:MAG: VOC family protein [Myxococcales bacterium]
MTSVAPELGITVDCHDAGRVAAFWCVALEYVEAPPPTGWADWPSFLRDHDVPEDEWNDGASIVPATGTGPRISFLKVPESKTVKNRIHLDVRISGGRHEEQSLREARIREKVAQLQHHGASVLREDRLDDRLDHVVMLDPEGNEFCVV